MSGWPKTAMDLKSVPTLADLVRGTCHLDAVPREAVPVMIGELERIKAELWSRLALPVAVSPAAEADELLNAEAAAKILGFSQDYLYRKKFPFKVRIGRKVMFSRQGIDRFIRQRCGAQ